MGGARRNPGPAAGGVIIRDKEGKIIFKNGFFFGIKDQQPSRIFGID